MADSGYDFALIESKWRTRWEETGLYKSTVQEGRPKHYALTMLPYTSGDLHIRTLVCDGAFRRSRQMDADERL